MDVIRQTLTKHNNLHEEKTEENEDPYTESKAKRKAEYEGNDEGD